jgi:isocitrate dehydrogenase kinase/phosphatase
MIKKYCKSIGRILGKVINKLKDQSFIRKIKVFTFTFFAGDLILDIFITAPVVTFLIANGMTSAAIYTAIGMTASSLLIAYIAYMYLIPTKQETIIL